MLKVRKANWMIILLFVIEKKEPTHTFKCFSPTRTMKPLQIIANYLKIRGQIQVLNPIILINPELNEELEEEVGDLIALPFP